MKQVSMGRCKGQVACIYRVEGACGEWVVGHEEGWCVKLAGST